MTAVIGRPPTYAVRPDWFDTLTPDSAYTVGLYQADGANQRDRGVVTITLKISDADLLTELSFRFGGCRPLREDSRGNPRLMIQNRALSDGLAGWGVVSPKTHTASTHVALLDDRDYWRGVIDGDGSLCVGVDGRRFLTLVGSRPICDQWLAFARSRGTGMKVNVRPHKSIYSVHLSGWQAVEIAAVLYDGAGLALARKLAVARSWGATRDQAALRRVSASRSSSNARMVFGDAARNSSSRCLDG